MTCRHAAGDPMCSSSPAGKERERAANASSYYYETKRKELEAAAIDATKFDILEVEDVGTVLILKVRYPSCKKCSYEGDKVLVYSGSTLKDVLKWKTIDPHFSDKKPGLRAAPSPTARFPASADGWDHALRFAAMLQEPKSLAMRRNDT